MKSLLQSFVPVVTLLCIVSTLSAAEEPRKIVFISGKPSHGPMAHEHRAGNLLLAKRLKETDLNVDPIVLPENGYPSDSSVLENAATIVVFCTGHKGHLLNPHLEEFDALMKKGVGVVMIHWATEAEIGMPAKKFLEWMGGFCDLNWSVNPHWKPNFSELPDHPITNGVKPFQVHDEWYYHMRFVGDLNGVTPILSDLPPPETLKRPDGARSGNPDVRRAVAAGEKQHVAWAYERPDGKGRGFGFTGAHNHVSWQDDNFRKVVLNAILWTAHVKVPEGGVHSATPDEVEIKANLDDKSKGKPKPPKPAAVPEKLKSREVAAVSFQELRERNVRPLDSEMALNLLGRSLRDSTDPSLHAAMLNGMLKGLEGRRNVKAPKGWTETVAALEKGGNKEVSQLTRQLSQIFGDETASKQAVTLVTDSSAAVPERRNALKALVTQQHPELKRILDQLIGDPSLQVDAIRAFGTFDGEGVADMLLGRYAKFGDQAKRATVETLATRKSYATALLSSLKKGTVSREDIPAYIARSLTSLIGDSFTEVYGDIEELSKDKAELVSRYKSLLTPERLAKADPAKGRVVFQSVCSACHVLYGEGGKIGPDLTGSNRADLNYILLNMIEPSADIPEAYQLVTIKTKDGQVLAGTLAEEDDQRIVLNLIGEKRTVVKSDVVSREALPISMMPEGLLPTLEDSQVLDLVKYLQTSQQVDLPQ